MKVVTVNIIAIFGIFNVVFFFSLIFLQEIYPPVYCAIAYILAFVFVLVFISTHTNKGIEHFNTVKTIVVLILILFYGFLYAKITYGDIWSFLLPIMIIFLTNFSFGLILCFCYFVLMLEEEFIFEIHDWELFYRYVFIYWSQVIMVGVYEALRIEHNKRMQRDRKK